MKKILLPLAGGVEEMEAVIIIDVLRRAEWEVVAASTELEIVKASRGVRILSDASWRDINHSKFDILVLPGGAEGTATLAADQRVIEVVREFNASGKIIGAICAAPLVLQAAGIINGRSITCHPAVENDIKAANVSHEPVVVDGNIITSRGPGTAMSFALRIIAEVEGQAKAAALAEAMVLT